MEQTKNEDHKVSGRGKIWIFLIWKQRNFLYLSNKFLSSTYIKVGNTIGTSKRLRESVFVKIYI